MSEQDTLLEPGSVESHTIRLDANQHLLLIFCLGIAQGMAGQRYNTDLFNHINDLATACNNGTLPNFTRRRV